MNLCAIDPGKSGGIAYLIDGKVGVENIDAACESLYRQLHYLYSTHKPVFMVENVGFHMKGNAASSSATFARHCGHIEMALVSLGANTRYVNPRVWMDKALGEGRPRDKTKRKNWIKDKMKERFPHLKITLKTADALGILVYLAMLEGVELPQY